MKINEQSLNTPIIKSLIIVSPNFSPAFIKNIKVLSENYDCGYILHNRYIEYSSLKMTKSRKILNLIFNTNRAKYAFFLNPSLWNLPLMILLITLRTKCVYWLHEPIDTLSSYKKTRLRIDEQLKLYMSIMMNYFIIRLCHKVLLPSSNAMHQYQKRYKESDKARIFNLFFPARPAIEKNQLVLSYIGGASKMHGIDIFLLFIKEYYEELSKHNIKIFLVCRNDAAKYFEEVLMNYLEFPKFTIIQNKILSDEEIDYYYSQSTFVWNYYRHNTQSGVLANSLLHSCIPIINEQNSEVTSKYFINFTSKDNLWKEILSFTLEQEKKKIYSENCWQIGHEKYIFNKKKFEQSIS